MKNYILFVLFVLWHIIFLWLIQCQNFVFSVNIFIAIYSFTHVYDFKYSCWILIYFKQVYLTHKWDPDRYFRTRWKWTCNARVPLHSLDLQNLNLTIGCNLVPRQIFRQGYVNQKIFFQILESIIYLPCHSNDIKAVGLQFWSSGESGVALHCHYSLLWPGVVLLIKILSLGQKHLFENY